jgi:quinol monooxygenase YgiN
MLLAILTISPQPGEESRIIEVLDSLRTALAPNGECLESLISVAPGEGGLICYTERWCSREALERHLGSDLYSRVFEAMELSRQAPKIEFFEVQQVGGLDVVADVRREKNPGFKQEG